MISKSKLVGIAVIAVLFISLSVSLVSAQYTTEKTSDVNISSDGTCTISDSSIGVTYFIQGTPGAKGTVTADLYNGNPQPTATISGGNLLTHFVAISFNMNANDFSQATITIKYTDSDVQNIQMPYAVFKYWPDSNSYVQVPSIVDTTAKTITVKLDSLNDPLLAIGGTTHSTNGVPASEWAILAGSVIAIMLLSVFIVSRLRRPDESSRHSFKS